jgi:dipeptidyl aminopeptidase/acylaminoacyl peptidase
LRALQAAHRRSLPTRLGVREAHLVCEIGDSIVVRVDLDLVERLGREGLGGSRSWTDGSRLAFTSILDGNVELWVVNADGSGLQRLTDDPAEDSAPAWSPDGTHLAFQTNRDGNWRSTVSPPTEPGLPISPGARGRRPRPPGAEGHLWKVPTAELQTAARRFSCSLRSVT